MRYAISATLVVFSLTPMVAYSEKSKYVDNFDLKPIVFDSDQTESSSLGLDFNLSGKFLDKKFDSEEDDGINPDAIIGGYDISYSVKGILAENSDENPKDFIESRLSANYFRSSSNSFKAGLFVESESDQKFDERQLAYGITATLAKIDTLSNNDISAIHINYGQVDPTNDSSREAILGDKKDSYNRAELELLYIHNIGKGSIDTFELNYRYFLEIDADQAIKNADLDEFRLITYRLGFKNNLYVAYSSGELPFNQKDNRIYELGLNYKFE